MRVRGFMCVQGGVCAAGEEGVCGRVRGGGCMCGGQFCDVLMPANVLQAAGRGHSTAGAVPVDGLTYPAP